MNCEHCRQQLLPFLYDLLDPHERSVVAAHLESCTDCQEMMKATQEQVGLLAEAVKEEHAGIVFKAPVQVTPASTAPTVAMQRPTRRLLIFNRWAIAASILFLLFLTGSAIGWTVWREQVGNLDKAQEQLAKAKRDLSKSQDEWNQHKGTTQKEIRAIQQQLDHLYKDWQSEEIKKRTDLEKQRVQITVNGPAVAQAGAPNAYQVQAFQGNQAIMNTAQAPGFGKQAKDQSALPGMKVNVRAYSQNSTKAKTPLFEQDVVTQGDGKADFVLPSDLPITPGDEIFLEFNGRNEEGQAVKLRDDLKLVFPEFVTHLATDRPMYRPGETVRFRSLTLERFSLKPAQEAFHLRYRIVGSNGQPIFTKEVASELVSNRNLDEPIRDMKGAPLLGVGVGEFALPANLPGGSYTLFVSEVNERFHEEKRTFLVHDWQTPRFNKELQFHRSSYGPGDQVQVQVRVVPGQGMAPGMGGNIGLAVRYDVDGVKVGEEGRNTDQDGRAVFHFNLPPQIFKGVGSVTLTCTDGGNTETLVRTIPIVLRELQIDFYPEGGDLIAGLPNRVYFQARTPANRPADIEGSVVDDKGKLVARIKTVTDDKEPGINQGLGSFTFTPQGTKPYTLRIDSPIGIDRTFALPTAKMKGVVMTIPTGVVEDEVAVTLQSAKQPRDLLVGVYCRGRMLDHKFVKAPANVPTQVALKPQAGVGGVYRITVFEKLREGGNIGYRPLAERLVYRKNAAQVDVAIQSDRKTYQPGETVELTLQARNEKKEFVPAYALVAVVDQSVLKMADEKTALAMPTHFLLTTEIRDPEDLEYADFLLGPSPKAAASLDLLLGCQGWRRFAEQNPQDFQRRQQQAKPPIFLANAGAGPQLLEAEQKEIEKLDQAFIPKAIELEKTLAEKEKEDSGPPQVRKNVEQMQTSVQLAVGMQLQADARVREVRAFLIQFGLGGLLLTLLCLGFFLISVGLRRLAEGGPARIWFTSGLGLLGFLFFASVVGTFTLMGEHLIDDFGRGAMKAAVAPPMFNNPNNMAPNANFPVAPNVEPIIDEQPLQMEAAEKDEPRLPRGVNQRGPGNFVAPVQPPKEMFFNNNNEVVVNFQQPDMNQDRLLRQQGNYQAIVQKQLGRRVQLPAVRDPSVVREYAHQHKARPKNETRRDFAETIYWHPVLALPDGQASVKFDLSYSVTRFQVLVLSHTADGRLGVNRIEITSKLPFTVVPKAPLEVTNTDQIAIPVAVSNESTKAISATLSVRVKGLTLQDNTDRGLNLGPNQNKRELFHVKPSITEGSAAIRIAGRTSGSSDAVERRFKVVPDGFPIAESLSGVLENGNVEHTITLPPTWIAGSLQVRAQFYPSPLAELQTALDAMLREPAGCFEQSASSNDPNVMILNYMTQQSRGKPFLPGDASFQPSPVLEKRSRQLLQSGYQQLANFECVDADHEAAKRGYEWFGGAVPPNEALTAYALMQFRDMAKFYPVDEAMLKRTQQYLLDQRDKKGGFQRNPNGIDRFGRAPDHITNAYILWALSAGAVNENFDAELAAVRASCKEHKDPYLLALAALSHLNRKKSAEAVALLHQLREHQKADGAIDGATTSITGSQGHDLRVEATALAALAWIKADRPGEFGQNVTSAVKWLGQQRRGGGGFGATQATILTLKALVAHAQKNPKVSQGGDVRLFVREAQGVDFQANNFAPQNFAQRNSNQTEARGFLSPRSQDALTLTLPDPTIVRPGKNVVGLSVNGANQLPYTLSWNYRTVKPANDPKAAVQIKTKLDRDRAVEGETVKLTATIENVSGKGHGMAVAIIGLPAGLGLPENFQQLKAYEKWQDNGTKPGKISAWELRGRELVLYWRDLAPDAKIELDFDLVCRLPGQYRSPASRAYLYYDADRKFWIAPLNIRIVEAE